ncbi:cGMP-dependent protein kinase 2 [Bubalus kerabau]|uniref:cGMP-dependent protein kinase 2 n=1 Tax=Bubalus carabanensis TaxID=3119969 RepID=UPI00244EFCF6|nr:cGMP-dependent protein kinase 2 [Bubalus carabanensis]
MLTSEWRFCCDAFDSCPERATKENSRSLSKMGNGSVKPKHSKNPDGYPGNLTASALRSRVTELERELRRKDAEIQEREYHLKELREQLSKQTVAIAELTEELQNKCIQLNKLQDVVHLQGGSLPRASPDKVPLEVQRKTSGLVSLHSRRGAKAGVSAEPTTRTYDLNKPPEFSFEKARVRKDSSEKKLITDALNKNQFLKRLDPQQIKDMVECMYGRNYQQGSYIIKQGEPGNHIFVLAEGRLEVSQGEKLLSSIPMWTTFGELAILYNCTRTASVKAITNVKTWALDREVFQNIMRRTAQARDEQYRNFLRRHNNDSCKRAAVMTSRCLTYMLINALSISVSLLKNLPEDKLTKIIDCLEVEYYDKGDYIIREGEEGSTFFILAKGKVKVTQSTEGHDQPQLIKTLQKGEYFGEKALISEDVRSANIIAEENDVACLVIDRETFNQTVGTFEELQKYLEGYVANLNRDDEKRHAKRSMSSWKLSKALSLEMIQLKEKVARFSSSSPFQNLEIIATLGVGGFGRVELVKVKNENVAFAMKCIRKKHIVDTKQQEHVYSEKKILEELCSPFIVKLYRTFKDNKYVYMLLEACLGGELWSILRDRGSFDEPTSKFCVACVTEAFDYLHRLGIIYRDLKPENLILDAEGYLKLVDFGFAKKIGSGQKTWTFCGTPEYVAPEVILNKGHDFSVDFWSLGILVYELLTGNPPFSGIDQMMTYNLILKGIEKMDFPRKITRRPEDLIRRLCRQNPTERLGNLKNGINDIKKHRWLNGFNWEGLKARNLPSPLQRELSGPTDHSYFDKYPPERGVPPDELSGWDKDF